MPKGVAVATPVQTESVVKGIDMRSTWYGAITKGDGYSKPTDVRDAFNVG